MSNVMHFYCRKVLPLVYDESLSYYEQLCKIMNTVNNIMNDEHQVQKLIEQTGETLESIKKQNKAINDELIKFKNGEYVNVYINQLGNWIDSNLQELVGRVVHFVQFGINKDGYFIATVPNNWDNLTFSTVLDPNNENYGCLVLHY